MIRTFRNLKICTASSVRCSKYNHYGYEFLIIQGVTTVSTVVIAEQREIVDSEWSVDALHIDQEKTVSSYSILVSISLLFLVWLGPGLYNSITAADLGFTSYSVMPIFRYRHENLCIRELFLILTKISYHSCKICFPGLSSRRLDFFFSLSQGISFTFLKTNISPFLPYACLYLIGKYSFRVLEMLILPVGAGIRTQTSFWLEQEMLMPESNFSSYYLIYSLNVFSYSEVMKTPLQLLIQFINYLVLHFSNVFADTIFYACMKACELYCHYKKHLSDLF